MTPTTPTPAQPTPEQVLRLFADWKEVTALYLCTTVTEKEIRHSRELDRLEAEIDQLTPAHIRHLAQAQAEQQAELTRIRSAALAQQEEIMQTLGRALGFPELQDCPEIGGQPEDTRIVTFEYTAEVLAVIAAERLAEQQERLEQVRGLVKKWEKDGVIEPTDYYETTEGYKDALNDCAAELQAALTPTQETPQ